MPKNADDSFYKRADAHIFLSNEQLKDAGLGDVSASMMYAVARFNACVSAANFQTGEKMAGAREEAIAYFTAQYRKMIEEHLDDYIANFSNFRSLGKG